MAIQLITVPVATGDDDLGGLNINDLTVPNPASSFQLCGLLLLFGTIFNYTAYFKFNLPIRKGSTISSIRYDWTSFGSRRRAAGLYSMGFLSPDGRWDSTDGFGFASYPTNLSLPAAERHGGTDVDPTVWHDDAPAWSGAISHYNVDFVRHSYGDGTLGQEQTMGESGAGPGLVGQLQSYLDDPAVEALRVGGPTGTIPVCLAYLTPYDFGLNTPNQRPRHSILHFDGAQSEDQIPTLIVEYDDHAVIGKMKSEVTASPASEASATLSGSVDAPVSTSGRVGADIDIRGR